MNHVLAGWRPAARLARREALRRPWRTVLVVTLVGAPVAALTGALVLGRLGLPSPEQEERARFGAASLLVHVGAPYDEEGSVTVPTDAEARTLAERATGGEVATVLRQGPEGIRTETDITAVTALAGDHDHPVLEGMRPIASGRLPVADAEVAVSVSLARDVGLDVGDQVDLVRGGTATVVGTVWVQDPDGNDDLVLTATAPNRAHESDLSIAFVVDPVASSALEPRPTTNPIWIEGPFDLDRAQAAHRGLRTGAFVLGGLALVAAAIVASSAFAVGARRQLRTLGLLGANGAPSSVIRLVVLFQGTVSGIVGAAAGVALGIGAAAALAARLDDLTGRSFPPFTVRPLDVIGAFVLGVLAATAAASIPAVTAGRVPILASLSGRRPQARVPASVPLRGLVVTFVGLGGLTLWRDANRPLWTVGLGLAVVATFGTIAICPWLVGLLEPLAGRTSGGLRLAARGLARNRMRSGAVVAAILAPTALAAFGVTALTTTEVDGNFDNGLDRHQILVTHHDAFAAEAPAADGGRRASEAIDRAVAALGDDAVVADLDVLAVRLPDTTDGSGAGLQPLFAQVGFRGGFIGIVTPDLLDAIDAPPEARSALADGRAVVFAEAADDATVSAVSESFTGSFDAETEARLADALSKALADPVRVPRTSGDQVVALVAPGVFDAGFVATPYAAIARASAPIDAATAELVYDAVYEIDQTAATEAYLLGRSLTMAPLSLDTGFRPAADDGIRLRTIAVLATLALSLAVVTVTLALSAAEEREERAVLAAIGAPPGLRRSTAAWQALLLPLLAAVLAVPLGVLAADAVLRQDLDLPVATLLGLLVVVPVGSGMVARAVAGVAGRSTRPIMGLLDT